MKEGETMEVMIIKRVIKGNQWHGEHIEEVLINGQKSSVEYLIKKLYGKGE